MIGQELLIIEQNDVAVRNGRHCHDEDQNFLLYIFMYSSKEILHEIGFIEKMRTA